VGVLGRMTYNGWPNRETWLVGLHYNPESKEDVLMIKDFLEDEYFNICESHTFFGDMIDFNAIDWRRLEVSAEED